jgi:hypothetical protein
MNTSSAPVTKKYSTKESPAAGAAASYLRSPASSTGSAPSTSSLNSFGQEGNQSFLLNSQLLSSSDDDDAASTESDALTADSNIISHIDSSSSPDQQSYSDTSMHHTASENFIIHADHHTSLSNNEYDSNARGRPGRKLDEDWVVFSPAETNGTVTPLAYPSHNGAGSFLSQLEQAFPSSSMSDHTVERINQWRLNQSQHILNEFTKLEERRGGAAESAVDGQINSWGLPQNEVDDINHTATGTAAAASAGPVTDRVYTHDEIALALSVGLSTPASTAFNLGHHRNSHGNHTLAKHHEDTVKLIIAALENVHQAYQQDVLDQALNSILHPEQSELRYSPYQPWRQREGQYTASSPPSTPSTPSLSIWKYIKSKVLGLYDFIGLNDEVLEIILGERFINPDSESIRSYSDYGNYLTPATNISTHNPSTSPSTKSSNCIPSSTSSRSNSTSSSTLERHNVSREIVNLLSNQESLLLLRTRILTELFHNQQQEYAPDHENFWDTPVGGTPASAKNTKSATSETKSTEDSLIGVW